MDPVNRTNISSEGSPSVSSADKTAASSNKPKRIDLKSIKTVNNYKPLNAPLDPYPSYANFRTPPLQALPPLSECEPCEFSEEKTLEGRDGQVESNKCENNVKPKERSQRQATITKIYLQKHGL